MRFTICVLLYGNYPRLAQRCISSIINAVPKDSCELRIAMNAVPQSVSDWVKTQQPDHVFEFEDNIHKYPAMRQMVHGVVPIVTPYTMWFDDDSYVSDTSGNWLPLVETAMQSADMIGSLYMLNWIGKQRDFVKAQPWYTGKDPELRSKIRFATGGWWTMRTELLYRYNYPWPVLDHRGGDAMLGELCFQQDLRLRQFNTGVCINADDQGRESRSPRRGFDQRPVGHDFDPGVSDTLNRATNVPPIALPRQRRIIDL